MENKEKNRKELNVEEMDRVSGGGIVSDNSAAVFCCQQCGNLITQAERFEGHGLCRACRRTGPVSSQFRRHA